MNLVVEETWVNKTRGYIMGESGIYESFADNSGELYKNMRKYYGKCTSKIYIDNLKSSQKKPTQIGWVFEKEKRYEDTKEKYIQETWVTVHKKEPTVTTEYHYFNFGRKKK